MLASPTVKWPKEFYELRRGVGCPMCAQGRPEETEYGILMAASVLAVIPVELFFLVIQRRFVEGIATTGIRG